MQNIHSTGTNRYAFSRLLNRQNANKKKMKSSPPMKMLHGAEGLYPIFRVTFSTNREACCVRNVILYESTQQILIVFTALASPYVIMVTDRCTLSCHNVRRLYCSAYLNFTCTVLFACSYQQLSFIQLNRCTTILRTAICFTAFSGEYSLARLSLPHLALSSSLPLLLFRQFHDHSTPQLP